MLCLASAANFRVINEPICSLGVPCARCSARWLHDNAHRQASSAPSASQMFCVAEQEVNCGKQKALGGGTSNLKKTMEYLDETPAFLVPDGTDSSGQDAQPDRGSKSVDSLPESASESQDQACQSPEISIQNPVAQKTPDAEVTPPTSRSPKPNTPHHGVCRSPVAGSSGGGNGIGDHQLPQAILSSTDGRSQTRTAARRLSLESQPSVTDQQGLQHQVESLNLHMHLLVKHEHIPLSVITALLFP